MCTPFVLLLGLLLGAPICTAPQLVRGDRAVVVAPEATAQEESPIAADGSGVTLVSAARGNSATGLQSP